MCFRLPERKDYTYCVHVINAYRRLLKPAVLTGLPRLALTGKSRNDTVFLFSGSPNDNKTTYLLNIHLKQCVFMIFGV